MNWHYQKYGSTPDYAQAEARAAMHYLWLDKSHIEAVSFGKAKRGGL